MTQSDSGGDRGGALIPWAEIFPREDFRFHMGLERTDARSFFASSAGDDSALVERQRWISRNDPIVFGAVDGADAAAKDFVEFLGKIIKGGAEDLQDKEPAEVCRAAGMRLAPDFLLLESSTGEVFRLTAGCVCFPSSWNFEAKLGMPVEKIHDVVPGLNDALGLGISRFLQRLRPDFAMGRWNWGLSAVADRNHHPARRLPRLSGNFRAEAVWARLERQLFLRLPSGGILFGIRIYVAPLADLLAVEDARSGFLRAMQTMPEAVAAYKGLEPSARERLIEIATAGG
jgi:dimethylamine monooxygenase subunit A